MIKFFRKIRQNLLSEGKTGKYIKYAIGEIILVVIGILIALQINNWNENRKTQNQSYSQLLEVQNEILQNIFEFDTKGNAYYEKLRNVRCVFSDTLVFDDYKNQMNLAFILTFSPTIDTQNEAFNKLIQNADNLPDKYKPLIVEIKKLYNISSLDRYYNTLFALTGEYFDFIQPFSESLYHNQLDEYIRFVMTNKEYKSRLATYSFLLDDITPALAIKKYKAIEIYMQMVALGFPNKNMSQLDNMLIPNNPKIAKTFIGSYTNNIDTLTINYNKNNNTLLGFRSFISSNKSSKMIINNTSTLYMDGSYFEFNDDKSMLLDLQTRINPYYKRILVAD